MNSVEMQFLLGGNSAVPPSSVAGIIIQNVSLLSDGDIAITELPVDGGYDGEAVEGLKSWIDENAADFFPGGYEILLPYGSGSKVLALYPIAGNTTAKAEFSANVKANNGITTVAGVRTSSNNGNLVPRYVAKLDGGFALIIEDRNKGTEYSSMLFSKDADGNVVCCGCVYLNGQYNVFSTDFTETSTSEFVYLSEVYSSAGTTGESMDALRRKAKQTLLTTLLTAQSHTEKLWVVPCTSFPITNGLKRVSMDGTEYLYNGMFCMKGTS
jgi:hypothetical protein